jgi:hypothetical protein
MGDGTGKRQGVELRVHGVGGDPPHTVLGMPFPEDAVSDTDWETPGGRVPVAHRRGDPNVRVFGWGDLTSRSPWFALWTLLLPFTLVNVAGWAGRTWVSVSVQRLLALLSGLILTALTVGWLALSGILVVPESSPTLGLGIALVAAVVLGVCATFVSARYARYRPTWWTDEATTSRILKPLSLSDAQFFDAGIAHRRAWRIHAVVAVLSGALIAWSRWREKEEFQAHLEEAIAWATLAGLVVVVLLAVVSFEPTLSPASWRWSTPAMAAGAALFLTGGVPSAALVARNGGLEGFRGQQAFVFLDVYGASVVAGISALVLVGICVLLRKAPAELHDDEDPPKPPREHLLFTPKARRAARQAQVFRHIDLVASAMAGAFVVGGIIVFASRVFDDDGRPQWAEWPGKQLVWVALSALGVVVAFLVRDLWRNSRSLDRRRKIGQLWDVLTFWPRSVHPLAVRPYAERAVPELQQYLSRHSVGPVPDRWSITAHSQGSVLVYAALRGLPSDHRGAAPIDLLTFGSPLSTLYAKAFPCYFDIAGFNEVREDLGQGADQAKKGSWYNLFRATDAVGREVFTDSFATRDPWIDRALGDPNQEEPTSGDCDPDGDHDLPTDGNVWGHSGYRRSRRLKALVRQSRHGGDACGG